MGREIRGLFIHIPVAIVGGTCIGLALNAFLFGPIIGVFRLHPNQLPNLGPFNPLLWASSLILGLLINYRTHHRSAYWVAGVGVCYLLAVVFFSVSGFERSHYTRLLFSTTCKDGECLEQMFVTLPFLNSIAYAGGAWFGFRFAQETQKARSST
jgi:hypothetical protein